MSFLFQETLNLFNGPLFLAEFDKFKEFYYSVLTCFSGSNLWAKTGGTMSANEYTPSLECLMRTELMGKNIKEFQDTASWKYKRFRDTAINGMIPAALSGLELG